MNKYRKLIAALVGAAVMILNTVFGISAFAGMETEITNLVIAVLTAGGVERLANE